MLVLLLVADLLQKCRLGLEHDRESVDLLDADGSSGWVMEQYSFVMICFQ